MAQDRIIIVPGDFRVAADTRLFHVTLLDLRSSCQRRLHPAVIYLSVRVNL
jgi:hypothetical protein